MAGKMDWLAYGLPVETEGSEPRLVGNFLQHKTPYCRLTETVGEAVKRMPKDEPLFCPVLNDDGIVLGVLTEDAKRADPQARVEEIMELGPATIRPSAAVEDTVRSLSQRNREGILVTSSDGKFMGVFVRDQ